MAMTNNLKIMDSEYMFVEKVIETYIDTLLLVGAEYMKLLSDIMKYAIQSEGIHITLSSLHKSMHEAVKSLIVIKSEMDDCCRDFILNVDEKDKFLY